MADDEYEILPHQLLQDLKYDVEALKKKLTQPDTKSNELILEIESLKDSVHDLNDIFKKALEEVKGEDVSTTLKLMKDKVERVSSQNETIARALIAISDKLDDFMNNKPMRVTSPIMPGQHQMGPPSMPGPARMAPRPAMQEEMSLPMDMPPPPPQFRTDRKKGLF